MNNNQNQQQEKTNTPNLASNSFKFGKAAIATIVFGALMIICCFLPYYSFDVLGIKSSVSLFQCIFGINEQNVSLENMIVYKAASEFLKDTFIGNVFIVLVILADVFSGVTCVLRKNKTNLKSKVASVETTILGLIILIFTGIMAVLTSSSKEVFIGTGAIGLCFLALAFNFAMTKSLPKKHKKPKK